MGRHCMHILRTVIQSSAARHSNRCRIYEVKEQINRIYRELWRQVHNSRFAVIAHMAFRTLRAYKVAGYVRTKSESIIAGHLVEIDV